MRRAMFPATLGTTGARTPDGKVTEMPLDRLDPMFSEAPTRYSPSLDRKSDKPKTRSPKNTDGPRQALAEHLLHKKGGHPENEAVANAKDGGFKEFRSQYAR